MIITPLTQLALEVALKAHQGQTDKGGAPYINHPKEVAEHMKDEHTTLTALLHDVAEDSAITLEELSKLGFPAEVTDALKLLTHDKGMPYLKYIERIKKNPIATQVKIADLRHNSDLSRLANPSKKDIARKEKYKQALKILMDT